LQFAGADTRQERKVKPLLDVLVRVGGDPGLTITRVADILVDRSNGLDADTFQASVPNIGHEYTGAFKDTDGKRVEVEIDGAVRFAGVCDSARFKLLPAPLVEIEGRDYTSILIDECMSASLAAKLQGKTASGVAVAIAKAFGLTCTPTVTTKSYGEYSAFAEGVSPWEAIKDLATKEGFEAYVSPEKDLVFRKRVVPSETARVYYVPPATGRYRATGQVPEGLEFYQDKLLSLALKVKVVGFDPKRKPNHRIVYTAESKKRNRPNFKLIEIVDYTLTTPGGVQARAVAELARISLGLVTGELSVTVDAGLEPGQAILVTGPGAGPLADRYFVSRVRHGRNRLGAFTTAVSFASRPLIEARDMEVEKEKESSGGAKAW
jgi:prophage tail gpP-like protein